MHIRTMSRVQPQKAYNIQQVLDIVLQFINVLEAVQRLVPDTFNVQHIVNNLKGVNSTGM